MLLIVYKGLQQNKPAKKACITDYQQSLTQAFKHSGKDVEARSCENRHFRKKYRKQPLEKQLRQSNLTIGLPLMRTSHF